MPTVTSVSLKIKDQITALVDEAYRDCEIVATPLYPNVLVRLLPRTQISKGGIILPEKQNKVLVEAVVLETFVPFYKRWRVTETQQDGRTLTKSEDQLVVCNAAIGDHVVFQHFIGVPVPQLDAGFGEYRLVDENQLVMKLDYEKKNATRDWLAVKLVEAGIASPILAPAKADEILADADLVRKDLHSLTQSGV